MKNIIICMFVLLTGVVFSPQTCEAKAVKLGRMGEDNQTLDIKSLLGRDTVHKKPDCVRNKDCAGGMCVANKCETCTYTCPVGYSSSSTGKCASVAKSITGVASLSSCPAKTITCYSVGSECGVGSKCSGGTSCVPICTGVTCSNGQKCDTTTGVCQTCCTAITNGSCVGCESVCNSGYVMKSGACVPEDPCSKITCVGGKTCTAGECLCPSNKAHEQAGVCVECRTDSHCTGINRCVGYMCKAVSCTYTCPTGMTTGTGKCGSKSSTVSGVKSDSLCPNKTMTCYSAGTQCGTESVCKNDRCETCTYSCPSGYSPSSTGCGSVSKSVVGVASFPSCPDKIMTCYSKGTECASGSSCKENICVAKKNCGAKCGKPPYGCYDGPGGSCYSGPGGPLYDGPGGPCYDGPGGACYSGPGASGACPDICR